MKLKDDEILLPPVKMQCSAGLLDDKRQQYWYCIKRDKHDGNHLVVDDCPLDLCGVGWERRSPPITDSQRLDFLSMYPNELENVRWRVLNEDAGPGKSSVREAIDYFMNNNVAWRRHLNTKTV